MSTSEAGLRGLTVLTFESRRGAEISELIRRHGGTPVLAPALRELPREDHAPALTLLDRLERGTIDVVILLTGVGTRALVEAVASRCSRERFADLLRRCKLVARGPKPVAALRELGLTPALVAPEPNTWRELLAALDRELPLAKVRVAVQEYGESNPELIAALHAREAEVVTVPVYQWELPTDLAPLRSAIGRLLNGDVDAVLFTSAIQVHHLFRVADSDGIERARLHHVLTRAVIASIGPICSAALHSYSLHPDLEPTHPKMGHLLTALAQRARALLADKQAA
ncbi:MAG TPA: uroporphyrinogen-III synthase [Candidatus Binatia bacterium]|nr:uroporphyrinogen-III synthase [Candidatus Binatia bacterium]